MPPRGTTRTSDRPARRRYSLLTRQTARLLVASLLPLLAVVVLALSGYRPGGHEVDLGWLARALAVQVAVLAPVLVWHLRCWRRSARQLAAVLHVAEGLAAGRITDRVPLEGPADEVLRMAAAVNKAADNTQMLLAAIACHASTIHDTVSRLSESSAAVARHSAETAQQAMMLSLSTDEVTSGVTALLEGAQDLRRTTETISERAGEAVVIASQGVDAATRTSATVTALGEASTEISDVAAFISGVAGQTNLLALNATIEAARAGEAGKGFGVVAGEVKDLAMKTSEASGSIDARIAAIRAGTADAATALAGIEAIIAEISACQDGINAAVLTQRAATEEMSGRVERTGADALAITVNVGELASAAGSATDGTRVLAGSLAELLEVAQHLHELTADYEDLDLVPAASRGATPAQVPVGASAREAEPLTPAVTAEAAIELF